MAESSLKLKSIDAALLMMIWTLLQISALLAVSNMTLGSDYNLSEYATYNVSVYCFDLFFDELLKPGRPSSQGSYLLKSLTLKDLSLDSLHD
jgi:hypothetical protein